MRSIIIHLTNKMIYCWSEWCFLLMMKLWYSKKRSKFTLYGWYVSVMAFSLEQTLRQDRRIVNWSILSRMRYTSSTGNVWSERVAVADIVAVAIFFNVLISLNSVSVYIYFCFGFICDCAEHVTHKFLLVVQFFRSCIEL